ncbi:SH3/SH2 adaptor [Desmophyllum pertusum]|uniref:SH3/SH2 adaptor n=1 Tax=Desmophyllum pertusum TaxID=174260 RepID=A0A9X0A350_9CNID|nr:SH3/SH2 adaptor [Desmophyllum pertusum]
MASASQGDCSSNDPTDISQVLESLGSLIGELDAIEVDEKAIHNEVENTQNFDLHLETLLADTDEFNDEHEYLIPRQNSPVQKPPSPGHINHKTQQNPCFKSAAQGHERGSTCFDSLGEGSVGCAGAKARSSSHPLPPRSHNVSSTASLRTQEHDYAIPPSRSWTQEHDYAIPPSRSRTQEHDYDMPPSRSRTQEHDYAVPPSRSSSHKGAFKEVALSVELHGSFKKVGEGSSTVAAQKTTTHTPAAHTKAQPNHYVAPSELGFHKPSHGNMKPGTTTNGMLHSTRSQQVKHGTQQVPVTVFNEDDNPVGLLVSSNMKAREACHKLAMINKVDDDPHWVLAEYLTDLGLERNLEDHENIMAILNTWAPGSNNKLLFRKDSKKYHFFSHTSNYFPPHLLDSENADKAVTEKAQKAKTILQQKLFSTCTRVPEIEGTLHCKDFGKKSWNKKFVFLRGSGLYSSSKGKSKASKDLECYVQFDGANLYNILNPKKAHKSPAEFCFCIVPYRARELKELKCLCTDDEKTLMSWIMAVRLAKFGPQLRQNYDDMIRKFAKLTKYREQTSADSQNVISDKEEGEFKLMTKEGQVAMDFTGERGKVITDVKEIQQLANTRHKVKLSRRVSSQHFIPTDTTVSGHHFVNEPWYHGRITREHSLELLVAAGVMDGLFLVRESSSVTGVFVLTFCMNRKVYHCQLVQDIGEGTKTFFNLGKGPAFETLHQLIAFYQQKPLNGVSLALRTPCPKKG